MNHSHLISRRTLEDDHLIVKIKVAFDKPKQTFEQNVSSLLDAIGVRPGTAFSDCDEYVDIQLIHFDEEDSPPPELTRGTVEFGIPTTAVPAECGFPLAMAMATYGSVYSFVREYQVLDMDFPPKFIARMKGPRFGDQFIPQRSNRVPRLGLILKPRFICKAETIGILVREFAAEVDYITDDELTVGTHTLPFAHRVSAVIEALKPIEDRIGRAIPYVANITAPHRTALQLARQAKNLGAKGVMVNTIAMGYDIVTELTAKLGLGLGIFANSIGRGVLTSGPGYRIAPALLCKLARLSGADAVYTGPLAGSIDNVRQYSAGYHHALTERFHRGCKRKQSAAIMSGGISLPELLNNQKQYEGPLYLSLGQGLISPLVQGVCGQIILECIYELWDAIAANGIISARQIATKLASKGKEYEKCLHLIRVNETLQGELSK